MKEECQHHHHHPHHRGLADGVSRFVRSCHHLLFIVDACRPRTRLWTVSALTQKNPGANRLAGAEKRKFSCGSLDCDDRARRHGRPRVPSRFYCCCRIFFLIFTSSRVKKSSDIVSADVCLKSAQKWSAAGRDMPISAIAIGERASRKLAGGGGVGRD